MTVAVSFELDKQQAAAEKLAQQLCLPLVSTDNTDYDLLLLVMSDRLGLQLTGLNAPGPVSVDFIEGKLAHRREQLQHQKELLAKAVGIKGDVRPGIVDATAGLGRDAFILASLGCEVLMLERSKVLVALLQDGLARAKTDPDFSDINLSVIEADAKRYFPRMMPAPEVIYLDPMFPSRQKSALVKKEMQILQALLENEQSDAASLCQTAMQVATKRVVVKRPIKAPVLVDGVSWAIIGKAMRFDVYQNA